MRWCGGHTRSVSVAAHGNSISSGESALKVRGFAGGSAQVRGFRGTGCGRAVGLSGPRPEMGQELLDRPNLLDEGGEDELDHLFTTHSRKPCAYPWVKLPVSRYPAAQLLGFPCCTGHRVPLGNQTRVGEWTPDVSFAQLAVRPPGTIRARLKPALRFLVVSSRTVGAP